MILTVTRLTWNNQGDGWGGFLFLFWILQLRKRGRWWLSDIGGSRGADEEFPPSSLTQGYGSILLSTLFLFHGKTPSFVSLLHLQPTLFLSSIPARWGSLPCFFSISICPPPPDSVPLHLSLSLSLWPASYIEASIISVVLSHTVFSLSHSLHLNEMQWQKLL